jgi:hypothetical protein
MEIIEELNEADYQEELNKPMRVWAKKKYMFMLKIQKW